MVKQEVMEYGQTGADIQRCRGGWIDRYCEILFTAKLSKKYVVRI
jgi:hypothetical protein